MFIAVRTDISGNLAVGKPTKMSSVEGDHYSWKAVDGKRDYDNAGHHCCAQTKAAMGNTWQVDLQAVYLIREVAITNQGVHGEFEFVYSIIW